MRGSARPFGVYVHVPFCARRCGYCDFATWTDRDELIDDYVDACVADLDQRRPELQPATSVFFGGGTPSRLAPAQLARILDAIDRAPGAEVTVECNPDTVDATTFEVYSTAGVNRVSLGAQSFQPHVLAALDRTHAVANVTRAVADARRAGIERVNVDLIYGAAGESIDDWRTSLEAAIALGVEHVSAYALTIEPGTPLGRAVADGVAESPDDDDQADKYLVADEMLADAGFANYEISNWARPGEACRHNELYWSMGEYVGIGCAAHGHTAGRRWWNVRTPERYVAAIAASTSAEAGSESLDPAARAEERFTLALRTVAGALAAPAAAATIVELSERGLLVADTGADVVDPRHIRLTPNGRLLAADVTARLLLAGAALAPGSAAHRVGAGTRYD